MLYFYALWKPQETSVFFKFLGGIGINCIYHHVTYGFQNESTPCSCLNVKELLAWNRRDIVSLSETHGIRTHNQLVRKPTLQPFSQTGQFR